MSDWRLVPPDPRTRKGTLEVLVIEPDPDRRDRIATCLAAPGREQIEIEFVETGAEAKAALREHRYNCVLLGHKLPDMQGLDVLEALDEEILTTPVIGLGTGSDPLIAIEYFRAGCIDFFVADEVLHSDALRRGIARSMARFHRRAMGTVIERRQLGDAVVKSQEGLIALARTDRLMGICNRAVFDDYFPTHHADAVGRQGRYAVCMADVDNFKRYNDQYGHAAGDEVLRTVAQALSATLRENDFIARYGGEEIVILLDEIDEAGARTAADRLRRLIEERNIPHEGNEPHGCVTVSIGAAVLDPASGETTAAVLNRADEALYEAKAAGRNATAIAPPRDGRRLSA